MSESDDLECTGATLNHTNGDDSSDDSLPKILENVSSKPKKRKRVVKNERMKMLEGTASSQTPVSRPTSSKAIAQMTSKKRAGEGSAAESKKRKCGHAPRPQSTPSKPTPPDFPMQEDVVGDGTGAVPATRTVHHAAKSGRNPLTDVLASTSDQDFGHGQRKKASSTAEGAKEGVLDIPEVAKKWMGDVSLELREGLSGYAGGDLNKIQHLLAEALIRLRGAKTWQRKKSQEAIISLNLKKELEEANKKIKTLNDEIEKEHTDKALLESAQLAVTSLEADKADLQNQVTELSAKVAGFDEEKMAILQVADEEVEEKIILAWNSHYQYQTDWFLKRYRWASQLYYYRRGVCDPPVSLQNQKNIEDGKALEDETGQGEERFERVDEPEPEGEEEDDQGDEDESPVDNEESPEA